MQLLARCRQEDIPDAMRKNMPTSPYINAPAFAGQHNPNARERIFEQMLEDVGDKEWTETLFMRQLANAVTTADLIDTAGSKRTMLQSQETKPCKNSFTIHKTSRPSPNRSTHFETED
ncbi:MAG TPA: hypothetical protein DIT01_20830 [Lentisphaeria bacterium]|nr:hypothetical protein [Lentisphaeria bacterium]